MRILLAAAVGKGRGGRTFGGGGGQGGDGRRASEWHMGRFEASEGQQSLGNADS